jgi:hypothetical protein
MFIFVPNNRTNVIINMIASFTDIEKKILKGQNPALAKKHGCAERYVKMIIDGDRKINSQLSKKIYNDLLQLIELLSPKSE